MQHNQAPSQDDGRRSRFAFDHPSAFGSFRESSLPAALRERAASQPPRGLTETLSARPDSASRRFESPFGKYSVPWKNVRGASIDYPSPTPKVHLGLPHHFPPLLSDLARRFGPQLATLRSI